LPDRSHIFLFVGYESIAKILAIIIYLTTSVYISPPIRVRALTTQFILYLIVEIFFQRLAFN